MTKSKNNKHVPLLSKWLNKNKKRQCFGEKWCGPKLFYGNCISSTDLDVFVSV